MNAKTATHVLVLGSLVALTGCKGDLVIKDTNGNDIDGVRVAVPMIVREHILYTMHSEEGPNCKHAADYRYAAIPSAQHYFVTVDPAEFSKTGFSVKLTDKGYLQELTFNTEPSADAVTAATGALTSLLPYVGVLPKQRTAPEDDADGVRLVEKKPLCDADPKFICFTSLDPKPEELVKCNGN